jgi:two-component system, cell cycle response regulator DivK
MTTILYVEDNEDNIYMLSRRLRREGFEVSIARTGLEGIAMARKLLPDLIIMDLVLPGMDGFEAAQRLRVGSDTSHIPIIALSASVLPEHQHRAIDAGCDDFDTKPVDLPRLLAKMQRLLPQARR